MSKATTPSPSNTARGARVACEDLAAAISFIFEHARELSVKTECYSLWGGSAGARMAVYLGSYGPAAFGGAELPRPGAVIMQYTGHSDYTRNDPPTFAVVGEDDGIANWRTMERRTDALKKLGIEAVFHKYPGLGHGFGLGVGTSARYGSETRSHFGRGGGNRRRTEQSIERYMKKEPALVCVLCVNNFKERL
ncbi:MAG: alpha/beta hydrolase [Cloacibacillus evryensis]